MELLEVLAISAADHADPELLAMCDDPDTGVQPMTVILGAVADASPDDDEIIPGNPALDWCWAAYRNGDFVDGGDITSGALVEDLFTSASWTDAAIGDDVIATWTIDPEPGVTAAIEHAPVSQSLLGQLARYGAARRLVADRQAAAVIIAAAVESGMSKQRVADIADISRQAVYDLLEELSQ